MIKTTALGMIYLLLLVGFVAGIQSLASGGCSDWLPECVDRAVDKSRPAKDEKQESRSTRSAPPAGRPGTH